MIHTIVECLFQQLLTAFAAATGTRHWSTTSERNQKSCHNCTSASILASCLNFSRDVITTRKNDSSLINANEIPKTFKCPEHSQNKMKNVMHNPWEHSLQGWVLHRRMSHAQPQTHFRNHLEHKQRHRQDEQPALRKNQTLRHNSPMMPPSCLSARCELVYGNYGWPIYYSYRKS